MRRRRSTEQDKGEGFRKEGKSTRFNTTQIYPSSGISNHIFAHILAFLSQVCIKYRLGTYF